MNELDLCKISRNYRGHLRILETGLSIPKEHMV